MCMPSSSAAPQLAFVHVPRTVLTKSLVLGWTQITRTFRVALRSENLLVTAIYRCWLSAKPGCIPVALASGSCTG